MNHYNFATSWTTKIRLTETFLIMLTFKVNLFKDCVQKYYQSVKWFRSRADRDLGLNCLQRLYISCETTLWGKKVNCAIDNSFYTIIASCWSHGCLYTHHVVDILKVQEPNNIDRKISANKIGPDQPFPTGAVWSGTIGLVFKLINIGQARAHDILVIIAYIPRVYFKLSSLCCGLHFFWFWYKAHNVYLTKIPT